MYSAEYKNISAESLKCLPILKFSCAALNITVMFTYYLRNRNC